MNLSCGVSMAVGSAPDASSAADQPCHVAICHKSVCVCVYVNVFVGAGVCMYNLVFVFSLSLIGAVIVCFCVFIFLLPKQWRQKWR